MSLSPSRLTLTLIACVLMPATIQAADEQTERRSPYVRAYTGVGVTGPTDLRIRQPTLGTDLTFEQVSWEHKSLSTDWTRDSIPYVGVRGGFFFREPRWLSLSVEVLHFKIFAEPATPVRVTGTDEGMPVDIVAPMQRFVQLYQVSNGVNMVLGNVQAHKRLAEGAGFPDGRVDLYGGLGAGVTIPFTRSVIDGPSQGRYEWGRPATQRGGPHPLDSSAAKLRWIPGSCF